jgi:biotin carboxyl carrier protein
MEKRLKLDFEIDGHTLSGDLSSAGGKVSLRLGATTWEAEVAQPEPGLFVVLLGSDVYRCTADPVLNQVTVNGGQVRVFARDRWQAAGNTAHKAADGRAVLSAPMAGKVVRILLDEGAEVEAQQGVLVVEAMKMQNEVSSPKAGRVAELRVQEGQTVNAGEVLAVIE